MGAVLVSERGRPMHDYESEILRYSSEAACTSRQGRSSPASQ
jgi:hypothetical protein